MNRIPFACLYIRMGLALSDTKPFADFLVDVDIEVPLQVSVVHISWRRPYQTIVKAWSYIQHLLDLKSGQLNQDHTD